jgi:hypothetical protein
MKLNCHASIQGTGHSQSACWLCACWWVACMLAGSTHHARRPCILPYAGVNRGWSGPSRHGHGARSNACAARFQRVMRHTKHLCFSSCTRLFSTTPHWIHRRGAYVGAARTAAAALVPTPQQVPRVSAAAVRAARPVLLGGPTPKGRQLIQQAATQQPSHHMHRPVPPGLLRPRVHVTCVSAERGCTAAWAAQVRRRCVQATSLEGHPGHLRP